MKLNISDNYFSYSKNILVSIIFIIPFLIIYEIICFLYFRGMTYQIRNSADIIIRRFFDFFGTFSESAYALTLFASILLIFFIKKKDLSKIKVRFKYLFFMLFEGFLLGLLLLFLLNDISITSFRDIVYQDNLLLNLYLCIGAGIWEEILFRFFLFSFIYKFFSKDQKNNMFLYFYISVFLSSLLFSMFHYIGNSVEVFHLHTFIIRFIAGIYLALLYYFRGFGITAMTHISYDFILVSLPLIYAK